MRIEFRIKPELKQAFASYCEANGQTITETLIKYIEDCTHNKKDIVRTDIESVRTNKETVRTKENKPIKNVRTNNDSVRTDIKNVRTKQNKIVATKEQSKIENKEYKNIDVSRLSFAQIMNLKRNNKT